MGSERRRMSGDAVKYLVILIGIIGLVVYIFLGGPKAGAGDGPWLDRRQQVWERIAQLETRRRDQLIRASWVGGDAARTAGMNRRGTYRAGFRRGFQQGYFEGSFLAGARRPNPLFFAIPSP